ncbi:MAG: RNA-guided endonuclease InsQ/TnpB family protein [Candidatus Hermodarchaeota archaeon]
MTYKTQIHPTKDQEQVLWDLSEKCRLLYNFALKERTVVWHMQQDLPKNKHKYISYGDQQNALPMLKKRYPDYHWVYSKVLQMTLRTLDADYKSFFALWRKGDSNARPPKYKRKHIFTTLKYNQSGFNVKNGVLTLSHKHPTKIQLTFQLPYPPTGTIKQVELYQDRHTKSWYVAFNCAIDVLPYHDNGLYQAFDLGIKNIVSAVNSQGQFVQVKNRRPDKYWRPKLAEVMLKRDRCKKFSRHWHWYNQKLSRMIKKQANQLRDFQHWLSKRLLQIRKLIHSFLETPRSNRWPARDQEQKVLK